MGALTPLFTPAPEPRSAGAERSLLDGTWRILEFESLGVRTPVDVETTWEELVIRRGGCVQRPPGATGYTLVEPGGGGSYAVDFVVRYANGRDQVVPGVYRLDGDTLTLCLALRGDRPAWCKAGRDCTLYTFDRVGDAMTASKAITAKVMDRMLR